MLRNIFKDKDTSALKKLFQDIYIIYIYIIKKCITVFKVKWHKQQELHVPCLLVTKDKLSVSGGMREKEKKGHHLLLTAIPPT